MSVFNFDAYLVSCFLNIEPSLDLGVLASWFFVFQASWFLLPQFTPYFPLFTDNLCYPAHSGLPRNHIALSFG